jgi:hypothetical protein
MRQRSDEPVLHIDEKLVLDVNDLMAAGTGEAAVLVLDAANDSTRPALKSFGTLGREMSDEPAVTNQSCFGLRLSRLSLGWYPEVEPEGTRKSRLHKAVVSTRRGPTVNLSRWRPAIRISVIRADYQFGKSLVCGRWHCSNGAA